MYRSSWEIEAHLLSALDHGCVYSEATDETLVLTSAEAGDRGSMLIPTGWASCTVIFTQVRTPVDAWVIH